MDNWFFFPPSTAPLQRVERREGLQEKEFVRFSSQSPLLPVVDDKCVREKKRKDDMSAHRFVLTVGENLVVDAPLHFNQIR